MRATPEILLTHASTVEEGVGLALACCVPKTAATAIATNANFFQLVFMDCISRDVFVGKMDIIVGKPFNRTLEIPYAACAESRCGARLPLPTQALGDLEWRPSRICDRLGASLHERFSNMREGNSTPT